LYENLIHLGNEGPYPVLTFSGTKNKLEVGAPSEAYVKIVASGIKKLPYIRVA